MTNLSFNTFGDSIKNFFLRYGKYLFLAAIIYVPVFGFLDILCLRDWNESRNAVSAFEMSENGDYLVAHYEGKPDMWNTKPPLLLWFQVFFMKIIGVNEIAVRLPSAIAAFTTCLALLLIGIRYLKNFWFGFIAILILITSNGYVNEHVTRTGDYDSLLTCFTFINCISFFFYSETQNKRFLYLFFITLTLAVLTKGIAGLLFTPALLIYCLIQQQLKLFILNKHFYLGLLSFIIITTGFYLLRELKNPGYIQAVQENELGGLYLVSQGDQKFDFWFYLNAFIDSRLSDRYLLVPCGFVVGFLSRDLRIRKLALFTFIASLCFFIVISAGKTRMNHYDAPLYPLFSLSIAFIIHYIFDLFRLLNTSMYSGNTFAFIFLFLLSFFPYQKIWAKTYYPMDTSWGEIHYDPCYLLRDAIKGKYNFDGKHIVYDEYQGSQRFYINILNKKGVKIDFKDVMKVEVGDELIVQHQHIKDYIKNNFKYQEGWLRPTMVSFTIVSH